jgi:hypothetical protein
LIIGISFESSHFEVIVEQVMDPVTMHDGNTFYGLYPKFPLPERCFSDDHIMYFTIKQLGALRSIAVDINTKQVGMQLIFFFTKTVEKNYQITYVCIGYSFRPKIEYHDNKNLWYVPHDNPQKETALEYY